MSTARLLLATAICMAVLLLINGFASANQPRSFFNLTVIIDSGKAPRVDFAFVLDDPLYVSGSNDTYLARYVNITVTLGSQLTLNGTTPGGFWRARAENVNRSVTFNLSANLSAQSVRSSSENASFPVFASIAVVVNYTDFNGYFPRTIVRALTFAVNYVPPPPPPPVSLLPAAALGFGGAGAVGAALFFSRRARLDELYLMHDSGMLIRHWSRSAGVLHDSDIISGMLIVLQEYIRDTWKTHQDEEAFLQQLRFGPQRVVLSRGEHTVLAAVVKGQYLNGLPRKLQKAVQEFERSHAQVLANWNGNVDAFVRADDIARRFLGSRARGVA